MFWYKGLCNGALQQALSEWTLFGLIHATLRQGKGIVCQDAHIFRCICCLSHWSAWPPSTSVHTRCAPKLAYYAISNSTVTSLLWSAAYLLCSHDEGSIIVLHAEKAKQRVAMWTQLFLLHVYCNNYYRSLQIVLQTILLLNPLQNKPTFWYWYGDSSAMQSACTVTKVIPDHEFSLLGQSPKKCVWGGLIDPTFDLTAILTNVHYACQH